MSLQEDIENVLKANEETVSNRRKVIKALAESLGQGGPADEPILRGRGKAVFTITQGSAVNEQGTVINVELNGKGIGSLSLESSGYLFYPKKTYVTGSDAGPWQWSHSPQDGNAINKYLDACEKELGGKPTPEREIQWQLARAMQKEDTEAFKQLLPVKWFNRLHEVGVSVTSKGKAGTGNIDLLVRRRGQREAEFLVFELKNPAETNVEETLEQAIRYAVALNIEANDDTPETRKAYRTAFATKGTEKLKIGAVVVMDKKAATPHSAALLERYRKENKKVDRLGMLLYTIGDDKKTVTAWEWLEGWDPHKQTPKK